MPADSSWKTLLSPHPTSYALEVSGEQKANVSTSWEQMTSFQPCELGLQGYSAYRFSTLIPAHLSRMQGAQISGSFYCGPHCSSFSCLFQEVVASEKGPHVVLLGLGYKPWASVLACTLCTTYSLKDAISGVSERHSCPRLSHL